MSTAATRPSPRKPRVLISGYYGFANLGDEALLQGLVQALRPHYNLRVLSAQPAATQQLHNVEAAGRSIVGLEILPSLHWCDVLIAGGGSLLQDVTSLRSLAYYLAIMRLARALGKQVVLYGQSLGPLSARGTRWVIASLQGIPLCVRDYASQAWLAEHGLKAFIAADPALLLPAPTQPTTGDTIVLIPRAGYPDITHSMLAFAQQYPDTYRIMPLQPHADSQETARLQAALPQAQLLTAATPQQVIHQLAQARYVFSGRLHGLILAAVAGCPFSGFAYDPKVSNFCQEADAPCHPIATPPAALHAATAHPLNAPAIAQLQARATEGITWLHTQLR